MFAALSTAVSPMPHAKAKDFATLSLARGASVDEAKAAFRKLALKHHPDKGGDAAKFREISEAFTAIAAAAGRGAEADALLADPLADLLGEGWARGFADGSVDPMQAMAAACTRAAAELGSHDPLAQAAADLGLGGMSTEQLQQLVASMGLGDDDCLNGFPAGLPGSLPGGMPPGLPGMAATADGGGGNMFKEFFDAMPEEERGPMLALFEKTFPAFLASELEEQQHDVENALFAAAVQQGTLRGGPTDDGAQAAESPAQAAMREEREALAEEHNRLAVEAFGLERYSMAAEALAHAIEIDPRNPAFYGNRSLALQRTEQYVEALADAESCLRLDARYVAGYERKGRALLGLAEHAAALAAFKRGLVLDPEHEGMQEGAREADEASTRQRMDIMHAGSEAIGGLPAHRAGAGASKGEPGRLR